MDYLPECPFYHMDRAGPVSRRMAMGTVIFGGPIGRTGIIRIFVHPDAAEFFHGYISIERNPNV